ncbi:uncharacterized protein TRIADDRAFT_56877 [Trichoplax adhaerens]|uniref:Uncharacterized protein n=1 Tax=Trichoplax adhaerens TaxID=10228 RepID=B3RWU2_TRIAD|nr:predicted protein [Trichoplax adhaerens]EDV24760.1 predicted protein [Trichoplax adhaerens]|eukprot:XP_002112650.1 predicted protein [Trichoplax adhaerens]
MSIAYENQFIYDEAITTYQRPFLFNRKHLGGRSLHVGTYVATYKKNICCSDRHQFKIAEARESYNLARRTGIMSETCLDYAITEFKLNQIEKEFVLQLMESYNIISKIDDEHEDDEATALNRLYFIPYLLNSYADELDLSGYSVSDCLYIGYNKCFVPYIPNGIFYCLLSACLKMWNNRRVKLYYQCAKFFPLDDYYYAIVRKEKSYISLQYCYQEINDVEILKLISQKVEISIHQKRPYNTIKEKFYKIMNERMPKYANLPCQFSMFDVANAIK